MLQSRPAASRATQADDRAGRFIAPASPSEIAVELEPEAGRIPGLMAGGSGVVMQDMEISLRDRAWGLFRVSCAGFPDRCGPAQQSGFRADGRPGNFLSLIVNPG
ncbi:hypothetical protein RBY4I_3550 [Rhodobacterales bacterium Y4I]|nr:hypothetical protein RBY4I_3550 [Rhodobacterales bacterium Y4I]